MPFYVRLASNEKSNLSGRSSRNEPQQTSVMGELCQGIGVGLGALALLFAAYWIVSAHLAGFPDLQSLQNFWFTPR
jgi:hypothetical protein